MFIEFIQSLILFSILISFMFPIYESIKGRHSVQINLHKKIYSCFMNGECDHFSSVSYKDKKVYIKKPSKALLEEGKRGDLEIEDFFKKVSKTIKDNNTK